MQKLYNKLVELRAALDSNSQQMAIQLCKKAITLDTKKIVKPELELLLDALVQSKSFRYQFLPMADIFKKLGKNQAACELYLKTKAISFDEQAIKQLDINIKECCTNRKKIKWIKVEEL